MASDSGALGIVDAAVLDAPVVDTAVDTSAADSNVDTGVETDAQADTTEGADETESAEGKESQTHNADGSEKSAEEQAEFKSKAAAEKVPASIAEQRAALKALKELDPKYGKVVRELHGAAERWNATKELLGVGQGNGVVGLKDLMQEHGAKSINDLRSTLHSTEQTRELITATDQLLYEASPELATNVYEDMKASGAEGNYPKVITNFLQHLKQVDAAGYYDIAQGSALEAMEEAGFASAANQAFAQLNAGDVKGATATLRAVGKWFTDLRDSQSERAKISKEREQWESERGSKEAEAQKAEKSKFENSVAEECENFNNTTLGKVLGSNFLKLPFFKEFPRETLVDLGNGIKDRLYTTLKADKTYQAQMNTMWKQKSPDKAKIIQYHKAKLDAIAPEVVRLTVQNRYPGYAKGGTAAGRVAAATVKKEATTKAATQSVDTGRPIYVASRPTNLVREPITVNGREYSASDLVTMQITGKGFVKTTDGKGYKLVTWRRS